MSKQRSITEYQIDIDVLTKALREFPRAGQYNLCSTASIEECRAYISKVLKWSNTVKLPILEREENKQS